LLVGCASIPEMGPVKVEDALVFNAEEGLSMVPAITNLPGAAIRVSVDLEQIEGLPTWIPVELIPSENIWLILNGAVDTNNLVCPTNSIPVVTNEVSNS